MPLASVITPVLNAVQFLPDTLAAVQKQTMSDWEHILIDDGSNDGSLEMMQLAAAADPRLRVLRTSGRMGPGKARNLGLACARGDYVAFLDADDLWLPQKLERCVAWVQANDYAFIYHDYRHISRDGKKIGAVISGPEQLDVRNLHTRRGAGCLTVVIDRKKLPEFRFPDDHDGLNEDFVAWLRLLRKGYVGHRLPQDLARYRLSETSRNGNRMASALVCWHIYRRESQLSFGRALNWWTQYIWRAFWMHHRAVPR
jgi:teichuronic acid biosynthesis glycosyltransferase TuaG